MGNLTNAMMLGQAQAATTAAANASHASAASASAASAAATAAMNAQEVDLTPGLSTRTFSMKIILASALSTTLALIMALQWQNAFQLWLTDIITQQQAKETKKKSPLALAFQSALLATVVTMILLYLLYRVVKFHFRNQKLGALW